MRRTHPRGTAPRWSHRALQRLFAEELELARAAPFRDAGHGYDLFGQQPEQVALLLAVMGRLHRHYFRVRSHGAERVPAGSSVILAANHSGTLPFDALMLWADVLMRLGRVPRTVEDHFVPGLPFIGTFFARCGVVGGTAVNLRVLLESGELVMLFPEGVPGISKPFSQRYQLQEWRVGHAELAIRHRVPVVPVAILGPEEQMPQLGRLQALGALLGVPHVPLALTPVPLPVRYHIYYGEPLLLHEGHASEEADDPGVARRAAWRVKDAVQALLDEGLRQRRGLFR